MENKDFVKVQKNGIEGRLHITTWKRIGEESNKEGWVLIPNEPLEVTEIREKKMAHQAQAQEQSFQQENVIAVKSDIKEEDIIKLKKRTKLDK